MKWGVWKCVLETFLAAIFLIAIVGLAVATLRGSDDSNREHPRAKHSMRATAGTSANRSGQFDAKSARQLSRPQVLVGAAYITDGDTITIKGTQIRLFGIDAPELEHPYGKKAKWALHRLCKGQVIRAEITNVDHYGRTVARCFLPDGRDLSAEMVAEGLAIDWPKYSNGRYSQLETQNVRRKLWLADARQKGRMNVWRDFEAQKSRE